MDVKEERDIDFAHKYVKKSDAIKVDRYQAMGLLQHR